MNIFEAKQIIKNGDLADLLNDSEAWIAYSMAIETLKHYYKTGIYYYEN